LKCFNVNFRLLKDYLCAFVGVLIKFCLSCLPKQYFFSITPDDDSINVETCRNVIFSNFF